MYIYGRDQEKRAARGGIWTGSRGALRRIEPELPAPLGTALHKFRSKSLIFRKYSHILVKNREIECDNVPVLF